MFQHQMLQPPFSDSFDQIQTKSLLMQSVCPKTPNSIFRDQKDLTKHPSLLSL